MNKTKLLDSGIQSWLEMRPVDKNNSILTKKSQNSFSSRLCQSSLAGIGSSLAGRLRNHCINQWDPVILDKFLVIADNFIDKVTLFVCFLTSPKI